MKNRQKKARGKSDFWTLFVIPTVTLSAVAGAIYYIVKNNQTIQKEFWSIDKFNNKAKEILLEKNIIGSLQAKNLYEDFKNQQKLAEIRTKDFDNTYKDIIKMNKSKLTFEQRKILNNRPKPFDADKFLKNKINIILDFEKSKFLDFHFTDVERIQNNPFDLRIHYEVFLNYEYASGVFETNKIKSTPESKYYYKSSQVVTFLSNTLKTHQGTEFSKEWPKIKKEAEKIVSKYDEINKKIKEKILKYEEKRKDINEKESKTPLEMQELEDLKIKINNLKQEVDKIFKANNFQEEIFSWFVKAINETNAAQDIYPKKTFEIVPFKEKDNDQYVLWNPKKGVNELTIKYQFVNINNKKIKSNNEIKIFTLDV
ncbi:hypothetical protein ACWXVQ_00575 [Mycoplasma sp. 527]